MFKKILTFILIFTALSASAYAIRNSYDSNIKSRCSDGSYLTSSGSGACSWHGGMR
ncbi:hypothetical protein EDC46_1631 [Vespertiliibacter pulmonis]|uniref:DUF3761 domain-containing protein n=1 Tax=Vespertiliibacter pulmonis TaxID=1443036 RepID=A0A3N4VNJ5_9PAST|nr:hypothetical protein EDC46_1631 [Vespertiliibacter pulmonis]